MGDSAPLLELAARLDPAGAATSHRRFRRHLSSESGALGAAVLLASAFPATVSVLEADPHAVPIPALLTARQRAERLPAIERELTKLRDGDELRRALRRLARTERLGIALREILPERLGGADVDVTAQELSQLADLTVRVALAEAERAVFAITGVPRKPEGAPGALVVLGMGKLGGRELNPGSDLDLVCFYDTDDASAVDERGTRRPCHDVWSRVVRRMAGTLGDVTEDGFVWRVDLRLRPEGSTGPLVNSLTAAERYYESFGRLWERAALLRSRAVAGDSTTGRALFDMLEPFVWSRQVDPSVAAVLADLAARARAQQGGATTMDLKLGPGGIREAEFFVQSLQLIWGGKERRIRQRGTLAGLAALRAAGLVTEREEQDVGGAYLALRRAEHAVQTGTGLQTHSLPGEQSQLDRLARVLGHEDGASLVPALTAHTTRVHQLLTGLLPAGTLPPSRWSATLQALESQNRAGLDLALARAGLTPAADAGVDQLSHALLELARHPDAPLGARSREHHRHLAEDLLNALADAAEPEQAAHFLRRFYGRIRQGAIYTRHLADDRAAVRRLATVLGASTFVAEAVATQPELGDLVLFGRGTPTPDDARTELRRAMVEPPSADEDPTQHQVGLLRRAKNRFVTQVALADLAGDIDGPTVARSLSALADASLDAAMRLALGAPRHGPVRGLCAMAMGKLGSREVGYGSDLDVVFLYDPALGPEDPLAYYSRSARRIIQLLTMPHGAGRGYELDTRLRPSGSQGLLVTSLAAFTRYHRLPTKHDDGEPIADRAATWERLALLKARVSAGDSALGEAALQVARDAAYGPPIDVTQAAQSVHQLRLRMERELARERPGRYDVKFGRGGLVDVDFCVQLLQLRHGAHERVRTSQTGRAIEALAELGALDQRQAAWLREGRDFLLQLEQRMRIVHGDESHLIEAEAVGLKALARRMGLRDRPAEEATAALLERYRQVTDRIRSCYEQIVVQAAEN